MSYLISPITPLPTVPHFYLKCWLMYPLNPQLMSNICSSTMLIPNVWELSVSRCDANIVTHDGKVCDTAHGSWNLTKTIQTSDVAE
jgi:hypothetical protein